MIGNSLERTLPVPLLPCWGTWEKTEGSLRIAREGPILLLRYMIRSPSLRRMVVQHTGEVSEDSHVGLLLRNGNDGIYLHLQCSASKALRAWWVSSDGKRSLLAVDQLASIPVKVTLLENSNAQSRWSVEIQIDLPSIGFSSASSLWGNAYSCTEKHYLLMSDTGTLAPDVEVPSAFLRFEEH